ncbi:MULTISPECIES: integrase core domain-containing protein [Anoxybacillus]|uniref:integrase core domain-containing protein n=1 Tax=Anoxybacillus sp. KU2-6(11) TaxID=1535751 RepID=UPI001178322C
MLRQYGIQTSMSRKGNGYDNTYVESFHSILKKKLIFHESFTPRKKRNNGFSNTLNGENSFRY